MKKVEKKDRKTERLIMLVSMDTMGEVEDSAAAYNLNMSDFGREAICFYTAFDPDFIKQMKKLADGLHLPVSIALQNICMAAIAGEAGVLEAFPKWRPKLMQRSFQIADNELITDDRLSDIVKAQAKADAEKVKARLVEASEKGTATITRDQGAFLAAFASV
jgi:hypothetical protein